MFRRHLFSQASDTSSRCYLSLKRKKLTIKSNRKPFNKGLDITKQAFYWSFCRNRCYCTEFFVIRVSYIRLIVNVNQRFLSSCHSQKKFPFFPAIKTAIVRAGIYAIEATCCAHLWNRGKWLHEKKVYLPQDWFKPPTWPPFHCFGT